MERKRSLLRHQPFHFAYIKQPADKMGGGNAQKSATARAKKQEKMAKESKGAPRRRGGAERKAQNEKIWKKNGAGFFPPPPFFIFCEPSAALRGARRLVTPKNGNVAMRATCRRSRVTRANSTSFEDWRQAPRTHVEIRNALSFSSFSQTSLSLSTTLISLRSPLSSLSSPLLLSTSALAQAPSRRPTPRR